MKLKSSIGKNNIVNIISNNIVHFLFEGGSSKSQHFTLLQYILEKNVKSDKKKPIGAPKFFQKILLEAKVLLYQLYMLLNNQQKI